MGIESGIEILIAFNIAFWVILCIEGWMEKRQRVKSKRIDDTYRKLLWLKQFDKEGLLDKMYIDQINSAGADLSDGGIKAFDEAVDKAYDILYKKHINFLNGIKEEE